MKNVLFARDEYLEFLRKRVNSFKQGYRQNVAIIGDELVGKTSIIFRFLDRFSDPCVLPVYIESRPETLASFAKRFIGILLYNFLENSSRPLKEDLDFLISRSARYAPKTCEKITVLLNAVQKKKANLIVGELFGLCELLYEETSKRSAVIIDEFQNLESMGVKSLYREWSKALLTHKNTLYIIVSSLKFKASSILSKNLSLLFGNFEVVVVEPFNISDSERFVSSRVGDAGLNPGIRDFLVDFTGGYPFYLKLFCDALKAHGQSGIVGIIEEQLFETSGVLHQRFSNYLKRLQDQPKHEDYLHILYLVASGRNRLKDIAHILRIQKKDVSSKIEKLLEMDALGRNGDFLKINDRVFAFWLRFVYQGRISSLTFDAKVQKDKFRDNIEALIAEFLVNAGKPVIDRIGELLRLFEDETMLLQAKRVKLSHFREIKPLEFKSQCVKAGLLGRSAESLWIMAFKHDQLTESDIVEFARECRKYRHKSQRKIIVTLKDVDANTRLRAMEEKVWAWDINNLNQIMDMYSKPRVIA